MRIRKSLDLAIDKTRKLANSTRTGESFGMEVMSRVVVDLIVVMEAQAVILDRLERLERKLG